ncbi:MAG: two pore domain potassium channel family protein, partial [Spirochaetales bacterium]|nr:two pore domain potassium channel family protein [Spirochaetales bacterium]
MMARTAKQERFPTRGFPPLRKLRNLYLDLKKEYLPRLLLFVALLVVLGGLAVFLAETRLRSGVFPRLFDSIWWAFVTITTVGYGDKVPTTVPGRILAILVMLMGIVAISTLSGTIASIFVDRKIREGKGLQDVNVRSHAVICGWNANGE